MTEFISGAADNFITAAGNTLPSEEPDLLEIIPTADESLLHKLWLPTNSRLGISASRMPYDPTFKREDRIAGYNVLKVQADLASLREHDAFRRLAHFMGICVTQIITRQTQETYATFPGATYINQQRNIINRFLEPQRQIPPVETIQGGEFSSEQLASSIGRGVFPMASGYPVKTYIDGTSSAHLPPHDAYHAIAWLTSAPSLHEAITKTTAENAFGALFHARTIDLAIVPEVIGRAALGDTIQDLSGPDQNAFFYARGEHPADTESFVAGFDDGPQQLLAILLALRTIERTSSSKLQ